MLKLKPIHSITTCYNLDLSLTFQCGRELRSEPIIPTFLMFYGFIAKSYFSRIFKSVTSFSQTFLSRKNQWYSYFVWQLGPQSSYILIFELAVVHNSVCHVHHFRCPSIHYSSLMSVILFVLLTILGVRPL